VHQLDELVLQLRGAPVLDALALGHCFFFRLGLAFAFFIGFGFL
jgi:hypothetical protein